MMKKAIFKLIFFLILIVSACKQEEEFVEPVPQDSEVGRVATTGVGPQWLSGFPSTRYGSSSVDLHFKTDVASTVYWVISTSVLTLDAAALKAQAQQPTITTIKFKGVRTLTAAVEKIEKPTGLIQTTTYYTYMVAESSVGSVLQSKIETVSFTTHTRQEIKEFHSVEENRTVLYLLYRPEDALKNPTKKYPLCITLAGYGETAPQGQIRLIRTGSVPHYINKGNNVDMMVMSIQALYKDWNIKMIDEGMTHALATYPVDTKKVYMTGLSSGGFGAWNYAVNYPTRLTAIVPISGGGNTSKACMLKSVAVYAFHNSVDGTVSPSNSINMVNAINACPPTVQTKLLLFPDHGHNCWRRVYDKNHADWAVKSPALERIDIYAWMLSKSK